MNGVIQRASDAREPSKSKPEDLTVEKDEELEHWIVRGYLRKYATQIVEVAVEQRMLVNCSQPGDTPPPSEPLTRGSEEWITPRVLNEDGAAAGPEHSPQLPCARHDVNVVKDEFAKNEVELSVWKARGFERRAHSLDFADAARESGDTSGYDVNHSRAHVERRHIRAPT